jgi:hypothetical protein
MPADDGVRLHNDKGGAPRPPAPGEQHPEHAIARAETRARGAPQHPQLLPKRHVLEYEVVVSAAGDGDPA